MCTVGDGEDAAVSETKTFGIGIGEVFFQGLRGLRRQPVGLLVAGFVTVGVYLAFRFPAQSATDEGNLVVGLALDLLGLVVSSTVALPWYMYALAAFDERRLSRVDILASLDRLSTQAVSSFWFWAGFLLGLRYLFGLPSILALLFYAFYGYVVADGQTTSGLKALGLSAAIGQGKRVGLFAIGGLLFVFNLFGAVAIGFGITPFTIALAVAGFVLTASITLVGGAAVYRTLDIALKES